MPGYVCGYGRVLAWVLVYLLGRGGMSVRGYAWLCVGEGVRVGMCGCGSPVGALHAA